MKMYHLLNLVVVAMIAGCTPYVGQKITQTSVPVKKIEAAPEVAAPVQPQPKSNLTLIDTLNAGKEISLSESDFTAPAATKSGKTAPSTVQSEIVIRYRVQVSAASRLEKLSEDKKKLEKLITDSVSIIKEAAYYKLYAGEFVKKTDAEPLLLKLKKLGYSDAWISTSRVSVKK